MSHIPVPLSFSKTVRDRDQFCGRSMFEFIRSNIPIWNVQMFEYIGVKFEYVHIYEYTNWI